MAYVVDGYGLFQVVRGDTELRWEDAGVVHQQVEMVEASLHVVGEAADGAEVSQFEPHDFDVLVACFADNLLPLLFGSIGVVARHDGVVAFCSHGLCFLEAHAFAGTGNDCKSHLRFQVSIFTFSLFYLFPFSPFIGSVPFLCVQSLSAPLQESLR